MPDRDRLAGELQAVVAAERRGFFKPSEDEMVRGAFARYLSMRAGLFGVVESATGHRGRGMRLGVAASADRELARLVVAVTAASMLVRSAQFLVGQFARSTIVRRKLDEAEPRWGIPPGQFSVIYRSLTRPVHVVRLFRAIRFSSEHDTDIERLGCTAEYAETVALYRREQPHLAELKRRKFAGERLRYWRRSLRWRSKGGLEQVTAGLFEFSGRVVSEVRNPFKRKRVTPTIRRRLHRLLKPGDVLITRHDDAMSNLFLPGFWPHAALFVGTANERERLGLPALSDEDGTNCVVEAKKDGVLLRRLDETLEVDNFCVLRPTFREGELRSAIDRALSHVGKLYDFEFDFRRSDRMACTEVVYRSFDGLGGFGVEPSIRAGRYCVSAEDLLDAACAGRGMEVIATYGTVGRRLVTGAAVAEVVRRSYVSC